LAHAIGQRAIQQGYTVLYRETHILFDDLPAHPVGADGARCRVVPCCSGKGMAARKDDSSATHFLNVDLDIYSMYDLQPLVHPLEGR